MRLMQNFQHYLSIKTDFSNLSNEKVINWLAILLMMVGLVCRLSPLLDIEHRIFWQYMSEDGYLMQTIARNMAIGLGMSTAEGTLQTNGVQPLSTFLFASLHYIAEGSKQLGIIYVTIFSALVSLIAAWFLRGLTLALFKKWNMPTNIAFLTAALWFASPLVIKHSMNGLETGLYYLAIITTLYYYFSLEITSGQAMGFWQRIILGILLGLTFLARNDAVFFIAAILIAHVASSDSGVFVNIKNRIYDAIVAGLVSILVGLPWLIYNQLNFGSIIPISGKAESHTAALGENLMMIPANTLEAALVYLPIPRSMEESMPVFILSILMLIGLGIIFWKFFANTSLSLKRLFITTYIFTICISTYYGLFFGAAWFVTRYLSALSPILWLVSFMVVYGLLSNWMSKQALKKTIILTTTVFITISAASQIVVYRKGIDGMHKQVVDWSLKHIDKDIWVGAAQTGTLGYFHDRTINLDGKTNPNALQANLKQGQIQSYVLDKTNIQYIVDWEGICGWINDKREPRFALQFKVLEADPVKNLCVMQRVQ